MTERSFSVTWDYLCPFARNVHEHLLAGLAGGADWDVTFVPFSLLQAHVPEGEEALWDQADRRADLLAMGCALVVRDQQPAAFPEVHRRFFVARHDQSQDLRDENVVRAVLDGAGVDAEGCIDEVRRGGPIDVMRAEHQAAVDDHHVFGVPTFLVDGQAVFVRIMTRPAEDPQVSIRAIEGVLDLATGRPELNEFKHTTVPR